MPGEVMVWNKKENRKATGREMGELAIRKQLRADFRLTSCRVWLRCSHEDFELRRVKDKHPQ